MGTADYGIAMTASERAEFERRANLLDRELEAAIRVRPDLAGVYIDHEAGGKLVVLTTGNPAQASEEISAIAPHVAGDLVVRRAELTTNELENEADKLFARRSEYFPEVTVHAVAVNLAVGTLTVRVPPGQVDLANSLYGDWAPISLRTPVLFEGGSAVVTEACLTRDHCTDPMKAGTRIRRGSISGPRCTMGFHVQMQVDKQFLTAGHCGFLSGSANWFHIGYDGIDGVPSLIGTQAVTLYATHGVDILRIRIVDTQTTNDIYGVNGDVTSSGWPVAGRPACASLGTTWSVDCGVITDNYAVWTDNFCGACGQHGGTLVGITTGSGDSGSPIWEGLPGQTDSQVSQDPTKKAVGIHNAAGGSVRYFARLGDALNLWGDMSILTS